MYLKKKKKKGLKDNKTDLTLLHSWKIIEYPDQSSHNIEMKRNSASCNKCIKNQLLINDTDNRGNESESLGH